MDNHKNEAEAGVGSAGFIKLRNRRWECRLLMINIIFNIDEQTKNSYEQMDEL